MKGMQSLTARFDLPDGMITNEPVIEIHGRGMVSIERLCGVLEYSRQIVRVSTTCGTVGIVGDRLAISLMTRNRMEIRGTIRGVELEQR